MTNAQIRRLIGTTNSMIDSIRDKTHWNMKNIKPRDVVLLGLCSQSQLNKAVESIKEVKEKEKDPYKRKYKIAQYLMGKGYEAELVWEILNYEL